MLSTTVHNLHSPLLCSRPVPVPVHERHQYQYHLPSMSFSLLLPLPCCPSLSSASKTTPLPLPTRTHRPNRPGSVRLRNPRCCAVTSPKLEVEPSGNEVSRALLLWRAAKLPIYSVAYVPLTVGAAVAYFKTRLFFSKRYFVLLLSSVLVITWLNLSNDVYDFDTGADKDKEESVVNIVGSRNATQVGAIICLCLGFSGLVWAFLQAGDLRFFLLVTCAIFCGYCYQCPPFRLSYQGLGEPLCFAAFGPFATTAFYFASGTGSLPLNATVLAASVLVGLTTTLILFCSHFHQIEGDLAVGKMSPLVRIGTEAGSRVVSIGVISLYLLLAVFGISKALPVPSLMFCALTVPIGKMVSDFVKKNHKDKVKIFMAKYYCVRLHTLFGVALASGFFLAK